MAAALFLLIALRGRATLARRGCFTGTLRRCNDVAVGIRSASGFTAALLDSRRPSRGLTRHDRLRLLDLLFRFFRNRRRSRFGNRRRHYVQ